MVEASARPLHLRPDPDVRWPGSGLEHVVFDGVRLVASDPSHAARGVPCGGRRVRLEFDRELAPIDVERFSRAQRADGIRAPGILDWELDGRVLVLSTKPWRPERTYSIALGDALTDPSGAPVVETVFEFETGASTDSVRPRITGSSPRLDARGVPLDVGRLTVTFDETMDAGRGFKTTLLRQLEAQGLQFPPVHDLSWDAEFRTLICPVHELEPGTRYVLPIRGTLFHDIGGNPVQDFDLVFETAAE